MSQQTTLPSVNINPDLHLGDSNAHIKANRFFSHVREYESKVDELLRSASAVKQKPLNKFRATARQHPEIVAIAYENGKHLGVGLLGATVEGCKHQRIVMKFYDVTNKQIKPLEHSVEITAHVIARMLQRYPESCVLTLNTVRYIMQTLYMKVLRDIEPGTFQDGDKIAWVDSNGVNHTFAIVEGQIHPGEFAPTARFTIKTYIDD